MAWLRVHTALMTVRTAGKGTYEITDQISEVLNRSGIGAGTLTVFVQHPSCSLIIMENADPTARRDLGKYFEHNDEGADDMPSHCRYVATIIHGRRAEWLVSNDGNNHTPQVRGAAMLE